MNKLYTYRLHEVVRHWEGLGRERIDQRVGTWRRDEPCCHGAHLVHYLKLGWDYFNAQKILAEHVGCNEAHILVMLRQAGAPFNPWGRDQWERERVYANLLQVEELPSLVGADLSWGLFVGADLQGVDLSEADLSNANLSESQLRKSTLRKANLTNANLSIADMQFANLDEANMTNTNLTHADMRGASLYRTKLTNANLSYANM